MISTPAACNDQKSFNRVQFSQVFNANRSTSFLSLNIGPSGPMCEVFRKNNKSTLLHKVQCLLKTLTFKGTSHKLLSITILLHILIFFSAF